MSSTHYLSLDPPEFRELAHGRQHALCLPKDEDIAVGDQLVLRECRPAQGVKGNQLVYTGAWMMRRATAVLEGDGIAPTHAVYSINTGADNERAVVVMKRQIGLAEQQGVTSERYFRHQDRREKARRGVLRKASEAVARVRAAKQTPTSGACFGGTDERMGRGERPGSLTE